MTDNPKLVRNLHRLADVAVSETIAGTASAAASQGPAAGPEQDLLAAANEFCAAGAAYLASVGDR